MKKYQTAVDQFWLTDWQTDAVSDWLTADHVRHFRATAFLCCGSCVQWVMGLFIWPCKELFVSELNNAYFSWHLGPILNQCLSGKVLHNSLLHLLLKNGDFLNTGISQGSVATRLGCGGVFVYVFVINFLLSLTVKKFENRPIFGEVMGKSYVSCFFDSQCIMHLRHAFCEEPCKGILLPSNLAYKLQILSELCRSLIGQSSQLLDWKSGCCLF